MRVEGTSQRLLAAVTLALLASGQGAPPLPPAMPQRPADPAVIAEGRRILERDCARCHSIEKTGDSPLKLAPPFRELHKKYPIEYLAEPLAEGIVTGHREMPSFVFEDAEIGAIITYIESLSAPGTK